MLEIVDLTVEVEGRTVLRDINMDVMSGYTSVLFGPNGSGKSTLLMTIMGFSNYKVRNGSIIFGGEDITDMPIHERAKRGIGMLLQRPPNIVGVRLGDLVRAAATEGVDVGTLAEKLDMKDFMTRDVNVGFSGGELKRSELLQLAAQNPCLYLLDEPESGVDLESIDRVGGTIRELLSGRLGCAGKKGEDGKSALVITHTGQILDYIEADRAYVLCEGTIRCTGNPRELLEQIQRRGYEECVQCKLQMS